MLTTKVSQLEECMSRLRAENLELRKENMIVRRRNEVLQQQCDSYANQLVTPSAVTPVPDEAYLQRYNEVYGLLEEKLSEFGQILQTVGLDGSAQRNLSMSPLRADSFITQRSRRSSSNTNVTTTPSNSTPKVSGEDARRKSSRRSSRRESGFVHGSPLPFLEVEDEKRENQPRVHFEEPQEAQSNPESKLDQYNDTQISEPISYELYGNELDIESQVYLEEDEEEEEPELGVEEIEGIGEIDDEDGGMIQEADDCIPELDETPYEEEAFPPSRPDPVRENIITTPSKHRYIQVFKEPSPTRSDIWKPPPSPVSVAASPTRMSRQALQPKQANPLATIPSPSGKKKSLSSKTKRPPSRRKKAAPKENETMPEVNVVSTNTNTHSTVNDIELRPRRSRMTSVTSYALPSLRTKMRRQADSLTDAVADEDEVKKTIRSLKKRKRNDGTSSESVQELVQPVASLN